MSSHVPTDAAITPSYSEPIAGVPDSLRARLVVRHGGFAVSYVAGWDSMNTRRVRTLGTTRIDVARARAHQVLAESQAREQAGLVESAHTLQQVIDEYLHLRDPTRVAGVVTRSRGGTTPAAAGTWRLMQRVSAFIGEYAGAWPVETIREQHLDDYVAWRRGYYQRMPEHLRPAHAPLALAERTLALEITLFKTLLRFAARRGYMGRHYQLPQYRVPQLLRVARPPFTDRDYTRLKHSLAEWARAARGSRNEHMSLLLKDYVAVLVLSGLRVGEANALTWNRVEGFVDGKGRANVRLHVCGKTGQRVVIPRRAIVRVLNRLNARVEEQGEVQPTDPLFVMRDGSPATDMGTPFRRFLERYGLERNAEGERYCLYCLRHTYALRALRRRVDLFMLARNMGTSVQMIQSYYGSRVTAELGREQLGR